jgi:hypothetical protein
MTDDWRRQWIEHGFVVFRGVFSAERAARLRRILDDVRARWRERDAVRGTAGGDGSATTMFHINHPAYSVGRRGDLIELLEAAADPTVLGHARAVLGEEPLFRCDSQWFNPTADSRDGNWHRDSQFIWPDLAVERAEFDQRVGQLGEATQFQIALVPSEDSEYVPGSHRRWDTPEEFAIRRADGNRNWQSNAMPGATRIRLGVGDGVIFNPLGLHRGRYHADQERRTIMFTYTKSSRPTTDAFSDQPWFAEPGYLDGVSPGARAFYERFIAAYSGSWRAVAGSAG